MVQGRRIAAVLAVAAMATVGDATVAPALSVGPVDTSTTTVSTPTVTVPSTTVSTPTVTVPSTTVTAPSASTPVGGSTPTVSVPKTSTPTATVPSTTATTPKVSSGSVVKNLTGGGGSSGSGSSGSTSGSTSGSSGGLVNSVKQALPKVGGAGGSSAGTSGAIVGAQGAGSGSGTSGVSPLFGGIPGGPGGGGFAGPSGFAGAGGPGGGPGSPAAFAFGFQRGPNGVVLGAGTGGVSAFAAAVGALAGCFYALTPFEQEVLVVRSGIDGRQAISRSRVAALLGTTPASIAATEKTALGELRSAAATTGCMPVGGLGPANALTAFIGGPFGPIGYVTPGIPGPSRTEPGLPEQTGLATTSFADKLATLSDGGQASLSVLVIIAVMLSGALAALLAEARRSVT